MVQAFLGRPAKEGYLGSIQTSTARGFGGDVTDVGVQRDAALADVVNYDLAVVGGAEKNADG